MINLRCHEFTSTATVRAISVLVRRSSSGEFRMTFRLDGDIPGIRISPPGALRTELWRHTCFEAFIAVEGGQAYHEFNFAPSRDWTVYKFSGYRNGGPVAHRAMRPHIAIRSTSDQLELDAFVRLEALSATHPIAVLRIGLAAVIETSDGLSYWALRHPADKPDFHNAAGFALLVEPPRLNRLKARARVKHLMKHAQPRGLNRRRVAQLLLKTRHVSSVDSRIDVLSRHFLGQIYQPNPLIGSAATPELFTAALDGFDCVTYIETILALARAANVDDFIEWLRKIRYEHGLIRWERRNHYMSLWIRNNVRDGIIKPILVPAVPILSKERVLNVIPGLAVQRTRVKCVPKRAVQKLARYLRTGDLIFFVSTAKNLDVFHAGIIARDGKKVFMRHASRSKGLVVEQELSEFLKANRMAGVIVVRPQPSREASQAIAKTKGRG